MFFHAYINKLRPILVFFRANSNIDEASDRVPPTSFVGLPPQRAACLTPNALGCSEAPALGLHGLLGVELLVLLVRAVVLLVDVAGAVIAVHGRALRAAVVLLLLHAAADVLLLARAAGHEALRVVLGARIALVPGALLVGLG